MKHQPKKHFDIHKPRPHGPDPTSKPVIVGHHPMMPDPMIREERGKAAKPISVISDGEELPLPKPSAGGLPGLSDISAPHESKPALTPAAPLHPGPEPPAHSTASESTPGAVFPPIESASAAGPMEPKMPEAPVVSNHPAHQPVKEPLPPTPSEPPAGQELHIPAGHAVVHHKPRIWVWGLMALIAFAWIYAAVDVLSNLKLPIEFFKNTPQ